nr:discoidin domain-containing protein [Kitasatospora cineracea]
MRSKRLLPRLTATSVVTGMLLLTGPVLPARAAGGPDLAAGKVVTASSTNGQYTAANVNDGNQATYWESGSAALPQWIQVDLGAAARVDQVVLKLPAGWGARSETLTVLGSTDGSAFTTLAAAAGYAFDPAGGNTVRIDFPTATARWVRVQVSANTGWQAAQISEFEVHGTSAAAANLLAGRTLTASGTSQNYGPGNAADGNQSTYWESANNAFPQWIQGDLGSAAKVDRLVLKLPPGWEQRSETFKVQGSTDGSTFTDLLAPPPTASTRPPETRSPSRCPRPPPATCGCCSPPTPPGPQPSWPSSRRTAPPPATPRPPPRRPTWPTPSPKPARSG